MEKLKFLVGILWIVQRSLLSIFLWVLETIIGIFNWQLRQYVELEILVNFSLHLLKEILISPMPTRICSYSMPTCCRGTVLLFFCTAKGSNRRFLPEHLRYLLSCWTLNHFCNLPYYWKYFPFICMLLDKELKISLSVSWRDYSFWELFSFTFLFHRPNFRFLKAQNLLILLEVSFVCLFFQRCLLNVFLHFQPPAFSMKSFAK